MQIVYTLIRCHILQYLIWVYTLCQCPFFGTLGINGLNVMEVKMKMKTLKEVITKFTIASIYFLHENLCLPTFRYCFVQLVRLLIHKNDRNHYLQCWKKHNYLQHSKGLTGCSGCRVDTSIRPKSLFIYNVQRTVTAKVGQQELSFLCSLMLVNISVKFDENISHSNQLDMNLWQKSLFTLFKGP